MDAVREWWRRRGKKSKAGLIILGLLAVLAVIPSGDEDDRTKTVTVATTVTTTVTTPAVATTPTTATAPAEPVVDQFAAARRLADAGKYEDAIDLVESGPASTRSRVRAYVASAVAATARRALKQGNRKLASSRLSKARAFANTAEVRSVRSELTRAQDRAQARKTAERQRASARAAERRRQAAAARQAAADREAQQEQQEQSAPSVPSGTCGEISATDFPVPPGDPRDRDGDGIACES